MNAHDYSYQCTDNCTLLKDIRAIHANFSLCGEPRNALLSVPDQLLFYLISLLKGEIPRYPNSSLTQWQELLKTLNSHWLLPLMYWQIMQIPPDLRPPKEILDILRIRFLENSMRAQIIDKQFQEILMAFEKEKIRIIVLKGVALARTTYPNPAIRPSSDIDLLIQPYDMDRSRVIMENLGYICNNKKFNKSKNWYSHEEYYYDNDSKHYISVEIHWDLNSFPILDKIPTCEFFKRAITVKTNVMAFEVLNPLDNLVYLAIHLGLRHNNDVRLGWIYDISLLSKDLALDDWKLLQKQSVDYGARISLENSLTMAKYWTGLKIPAEFDDFSKWPDPSIEEMNAFSNVSHPENTISQFKIGWPKNAPLMEKTRILFLWIFPLPEAMRSCYKITNNWLLPAYYILRWFELIIRIAKSAIK